LSFAELVGKVAMGEIGADDLVRQPGGLWIKASEVGVLRQHFPQGKAGDEAGQEFFNKLGRIYGVLLSQHREKVKAAVFGGCVLGCVLLAIVVFALVGDNRPRTNGADPRRAEAESKAIENDERNYTEFRKLVMYADPQGEVVCGLKVHGLKATIVVRRSRVGVQDSALRKEMERVRRESWARIACPDTPDLAELEVVDEDGNFVDRVCGK
jgi:hypothetical protein